MKKTVFLHIGYYKTGTTAVQHYFHSNRQELLQCGILYPETGIFSNASHGLLSMKRLHEVGQMVPQWFMLIKSGMGRIKTAHRIWEDVIKEITDTTAEKILISSEEFTRYAMNSESEALIFEIKRFLRDFDVKVLCYLRRQDDYLESWYNQMVKMGAKVSEGFSSDLLYTLDEIHSNYLRVLDAWERIFGRLNMIVRIYDRRNILDGDIIKDFLSIFQLKGIYMGNKSVSADLRNKSINNSFIELKRWCNYFLSGEGERRKKKNDSIREIFRAVNSLCMKNTSRWRKRILFYDERKELLRKNEGINREISNRYFNGKWPLFPEIGEEEMSIPVAGEPGMKEMLLLLLGTVTKWYLQLHAAAGDIRTPDELQRRIAEIERSRSWRITSPLRELFDRVRKERNSGFV
ncbi:MAG: hypothetical protein JXQ30_06770 [Spirochaetes bacterium]|nr:hypothetical protein [Spirochaetota bacterium]